jgi:hypothetical protein
MNDSLCGERLRWQRLADVIATVLWVLLRIVGLLLEFVLNG